MFVVDYSTVNLKGSGGFACRKAEGKLDLPGEMILACNRLVTDSRNSRSAHSAPLAHEVVIEPVKTPRRERDEFHCAEDAHCEGAGRSGGDEHDRGIDFHIGKRPQAREGLLLRIGAASAPEGQDP